MDSRAQRLIGEIDSKVDHLVHLLGDGQETSSAILGQINTPGSVQEPSQLMAAVHKLLGTLEEHSIYPEITRGAIELTGARRAFLMVMEDGSKLRWKAGYGVTQEELTSSDFGGSRSIIKAVVKSGEPTLRSTSLGSASDSMAGGSLLSALAVPIPTGQRIRRSKSSKNVAGLIYVDSQRMTHELTESARDLLAEYAEYVSLALENCWLYSEAVGL